MKIHKISNNSFVAELSENDMEYYCLDCESIDIENIQTRELISDLILSSRLKTETIDPLSTLNVDVITQENGSALVLVSFMRTGRFKVNSRYKKNTGIIALTQSIDSVLKLYKVLSKLCETTLINLYYDGKNYAVEIKNHNLDKKHLKTICLEFCENTVCDSLICSQIKEHYRLLREGLIQKPSP